MISGKEALEKVTTGQVQYMHSSETQNRWTTITDHYYPQYNLGMFLDHDTEFKFRLKPQTITIEILEFNGSVSMAKYPESINIIFSNKDDCTRWHNTLQQIFK